MDINTDVNVDVGADVFDVDVDVDVRHRRRRPTDSDVDFVVEMTWKIFFEAPLIFFVFVITSCLIFRSPAASETLQRLAATATYYRLRIVGT